MNAAADVYAFLAIISLVLLALARFDTPRAVQSAGDALDQETQVLQLVNTPAGVELHDGPTRTPMGACGQLTLTKSTVVLDVPMDGSVSPEALSTAVQCVSAAAPGIPMSLSWH